MTCQHCGKEIESGAKFCAYCGSALSLNTNNSFQTQTQQPVYQQVNQGPNPNLEKAKEFSKNYFSYFLSNLKKPTTQSVQEPRSSFINGFTTMGLFALLTGLTSFVQASNVRSYVNSFDFEDFYESTQVSFFDAMVVPTFLMAILLLAINGIIFGVAKFMKADTHFFDVSSRFGSLLTVPVAISVLLFLFSILKAYTLIGFLISFLFLSFFTAIAFSIYSFKQEHNSGLDPFFAVMITFLGIGLLLYIFSDSLEATFLKIFI